MKIGAIHNNQSFKSSNEGKRSFMGDVTEFVDSAADFAKVAKSAIDSPEEASVRVLTAQIDNVAQNKKTPGWARTGLKYLSVGLTTGIMGVAAYKTPRGVKNIAKRLEKFKLVGYVAGLYRSSRAVIYKNMKKVGGNELIKSVNEKIRGGIVGSREFFVEKFPKTTEKITKLSKKLHLNGLTKENTLKGIFAGVVGISSGKKVLNKYENADNKSLQFNNNDIEINEAA